MRESEKSQRIALFREAVVFQVKLLADGMRDLVLMPVSAIAALVGLLRGGDQPDQEFRRVIEMGKQSEQWINLFGQHEPISEAGQAGSIDMLLTRAEEVVREQAREGGITENASRAITRALDAAHSKVRDDGKGPPGRGTEI